MTNKPLEYYDGFWFARIPLLPGCMTQGETRASRRLKKGE